MVSSNTGFENLEKNLIRFHPVTILVLMGMKSRQLCSNILHKSGHDILQLMTEVI